MTAATPRRGGASGGGDSPDVRSPWPERWTHEAIAALPALDRTRVTAYRLARSHLVEPAPLGRLVEVTRDLVGVHAQVASSAELAVAMRSEGLRPADVRAALWEGRTLVRTWAMRGTLHLLPADELGLWIGALRTRTTWRTGMWLRAYGVTVDEVEALIDAVGELLGAADGPVTREELASALEPRLGRHVGQRLRSAWGEFLKPVAAAGRLLSGPSRGGTSTFVHPARWLDRAGLDGWRPDEALAELAVRYLATYGPADHEGFAGWWGIPPAPARRLFRALGVSGRIEPVAVDGRVRWLPAGARNALERADPASVVDLVRLVPAFDPYIVGVRPRSETVDPRFDDRVLRPGAWILPVVLAGGRGIAVWRHEERRGRVALDVRPFEPLPPPVVAGIRAEAERLGAILERPVDVSVG